MNEPINIRFIDTTLRDGEQVPGIAFSLDDKMEIAERLAACGVREIEAGTPAMGPDEQLVIRNLLNLNLPCEITAWCRARREDLDMAEACGATCVHISLPASPILLGVVGWTYATLYKTMEEIIPLAVSRFPFVSIGIQDVARTPNSTLFKIVGMAYGCCVRRVRLADSVGLWMPEAVKRLVQEMILMFPGLQVGVHTHNDLGMATANAVTAVLAGAETVDTTINGLGERAGNAPFEQVVMALETGAGIRTRIKTEHLFSLCKLVAQKTGRPIPDDRPVSGSRIFTHETGIHVHAQLRNPHAYQPYPPETVGRTSDFHVVIGKHSGTSSIHYVLNRMGIHITQKAAERLLPRIRRLAERYHRNLLPNEVQRLYEATIKTGMPGETAKVTTATPISQPCETCS